MQKLFSNNKLFILLLFLSLVAASVVQSGPEIYSLLGGSIESNEITDGTVAEIDLGNNSINLSNSSIITGTLPVARGGTGATTYTPTGGVIVANGASGFSVLAVQTNGQLLIGDGDGAPTPATLTAGTNVTIDNSVPGAITINATGGGGGGSAILKTYNGTSWVDHSSDSLMIRAGAGITISRPAGNTDTIEIASTLGPNVILTTAGSEVTGILPGANGGTNSAFVEFTGPSTLRVFTLPNAAATILTTNAVVTVAQGGTGAGTLTGLLRGNGTSAITGAATVALGSEVSGTLPIGSGGTGQTSFASGFVKSSGSALSGGNTIALGDLPTTGGFSGEFLQYNGSTYIVDSVDGTELREGVAVPVNRGGTGALTFTANGILYGNTTSAFGVTAAGAVGSLLMGNGSGSAPSFLTSGTSGQILVAQGTTNVPVWRSMGGDATINASNGDITITANAIGSSEVSNGTLTGGSTGDIAANTIDSTNINVKKIAEGNVNFTSRALFAVEFYTQSGANASHIRSLPVNSSTTNFRTTEMQQWSVVDSVYNNSNIDTYVMCSFMFPERGQFDSATFYYVVNNTDMAVDSAFLKTTDPSTQGVAYTYPDSTMAAWNLNLTSTTAARTAIKWADKTEGASNANIAPGRPMSLVLFINRAGGAGASRGFSGGFFTIWYTPDYD